MGAFDPGAFDNGAFDTGGTGLVGAGVATAIAAAYEIASTPAHCDAGVATATAGAYGATGLGNLGDAYLIYAVRTQFLGGQVRRCYIEFGGIAASSARATRTLIARRP